MRLYVDGTCASPSPKVLIVRVVRFQHSPPITSARPRCHRIGARLIHHPGHAQTLVQSLPPLLIRRIALHASCPPGDCPLTPARFPGIAFGTNVGPYDLAGIEASAAGALFARPVIARTTLLSHSLRRGRQKLDSKSISAAAGRVTRAHTKTCLFDARTLSPGTTEAASSSCRQIVIYLCSAHISNRRQRHCQPRPRA